MRTLLLATVVLTLVLSPIALAATNENAKVAVHVLGHASRTCTKSYPSIVGCGDIVTTLAGPDADCFPVFFDLDEYQGFDYSMTWPGLYTCAFTSCSDLTIGGIVNPGDGVSHAWQVCQPDSVCITGWAWIYDYGLVQVVAHPEPGKIYIGDCSAVLVEPTANFKAGIGGESGDDPCGATPIDPTSWGRIKSMFR